MSGRDYRIVRVGTGDDDSSPVSAFIQGFVAEALAYAKSQGLEHPHIDEPQFTAQANGDIKVTVRVSDINLNSAMVVDPDAVMDI